MTHCGTGTPSGEARAARRVPVALFLTVAPCSRFATGCRAPGPATGDRLYDVVLYNTGLPLRGHASAGTPLGGSARAAGLAGPDGACCSAPPANASARWRPAPTATARIRRLDGLASPRLPAPVRDAGRADPRPGAALPPEHVAGRRHRRPRRDGRRRRLPDRPRTSSRTDGDPPLPLVRARLPVTDVLLLALLVAVGAILGVRLDRTLLLLGIGHSSGASSATSSPVLAMTRASTPTAGRCELTWLVGIRLVALAAHTAPGRTPPAADLTATRVGWRLLALPLTATWPACSSSRLGWGDRCRPLPPGWPSAACSPPSPAPRSPSARSAPSTRSSSRPAPTS